MMYVFCNGKRFTLKPADIIGQGGEAEIYHMEGTKVFKIYKGPSHADYDGDTEQDKRNRRGAAARLGECEKKLRAFPKNLPNGVVRPTALVLDKSGRVVGYEMPLVPNAISLRRFSEKEFRVSGGIHHDSVIEVFGQLHETISKIHDVGVVIGDFNDLNIMISGDLLGNSSTHIIDADSFQFDNFLCRSFTERFVDPLLCDAKQKHLLLSKPHTVMSDWYAFAVMLFQGLLFIDPHGGVYRPKKAMNTIPHNQRPLYRVTVFDDAVKYPKFALHYSVLPDDLLDYFHKVFVEDHRDAFPLALLTNLQWWECNKCGAIHARNICPICKNVAPIPKAEVVRGTVTAKQIFKTDGLLLQTSVYDGKPYFFFFHDYKFLREDGSKLTDGGLDPHIRMRIQPSYNLFAKDHTLAVVKKGEVTTTCYFVDSYRGIPMFDCNSKHYYWCENGRLVRDGNYGSVAIGDVLRDQTMFWVGEEFGMGFYRAGRINVGFVFDAESRGLNDRVKLEPIRGEVVDATAAFSSNFCWFFLSLQDGGKTVNRCTVIDFDGRIHGFSEAEAGSEGWLGGIRGHCASGDSLFAATDDGIMRVVTTSKKNLEVSKEFPDTEPFVHRGCHLYASKAGIYVATRNEIKLLAIK